MSFGFSIGDIILLSQLSYNLWNSITVGRREASRDLKELESVLFSLRCSLNHLGDVAGDVLKSVDNRHGGAAFQENLNQMIDACGSTLTDLDNLTKKYRETSISDDTNSTLSKKDGKTLDLDGVARRIKVNWRRVRWDQEKRSLQFYREKLESHTGAINLILTSMVLRNTVNAEESSKKGHEKTHALLDQVLNNPQTDTSLQKMVQEIHDMLTPPAPRGPNSGENSSSSNPRPDNQNLSVPPMHAFAVNSISIPTAGNFKGMGADSFPRPSKMERRMNPAENKELYADTFPGSIHGSFGQDIKLDAKIGNHKSNSIIMPYRLSEQPSRALPSSTVQLNTKRRTFGEREFNAFQKNHAKPVKPAFLSISTPTVQQLQDGIAYIFRPVSTSSAFKQMSSLNLECQNEIIRWVDGFREFVKNGMVNDAKTSESLVTVLISLNQAIEKSSTGLRSSFYYTADQSKLLDVLESLQGKSKSVRVLKEIEEFEDVREDWG